MTRKYIKELADIYDANPYFDAREHKGCSEIEILQIKDLLERYGLQLPLSIEEDLRYYGQYRHNWLGIYSELKALFKDEEYFTTIEKNLRNGYWIMADGGFGVFLNGESPLIKYVNNGIVNQGGVDDPSYCHMTGDDEDDDIEIHICANRYSDRFDMSSDDFLKKYTEFYQNNPLKYELKQLLVGLYSQLESAISVIDIPYRGKLLDAIDYLREGVSRLSFNEDPHLIMKNAVSLFDRGGEFEFDSELSKILKKHAIDFELHYRGLFEAWIRLRDA